MDRRWVPAVAVALVAVAAGVWWGRGVHVPSVPSPAASPSVPESTRPERREEPVILVHVSGWVAHPGLVSLQSGARVGDALAAAGGAAPGARLESLNLAEVVADGRQVVVPGPGDPAGTEGMDSVGEADQALIHLNRATPAELESLPGVGPVLAERIVAHRDSHGPFQRVDGLLQVPGIGEAKLAAIRDLVSVP